DRLTLHEHSLRRRENGAHRATPSHSRTGSPRHATITPRPRAESRLGNAPPRTRHGQRIVPKLNCSVATSPRCDSLRLHLKSESCSLAWLQLDVLLRAVCFLA